MRWPATLLCVIVVAAGCSRPEARLVIGVKRAAVDLAFTDEDVPVPQAQRAVQQIVPESVLEEDAVARPVPRRTPAAAPVLCRKADPDGRPARVVTEVMGIPPKPGTYTYLAEGKLRIQTPVIGVNVPFPRTITRVVRNVVKEPQVLTMGIPTGTARWQYEVVDVFGTAEMIRTFQLTDDDLRLVKYQRKVGNANVVFVPHQGVVQYLFGSQGATWGRDETGDERGVDLVSRTVMTSDGVLENREPLDLCGEWLDTFGARSFDEILTLDASYSYEADANEGYLASYATHLSSLPIAESFRFTESAQAGDPPLPVTLEWRYKTRLLSMEPK